MLKIVRRMFVAFLVVAVVVLSNSFRRSYERAELYKLVVDGAVIRHVEEHHSSVSPDSAIAVRDFRSWAIFGECTLPEDE